MIDMRPSGPDEAEEQKRLWKQAFGEDPRYIDWFYQCCWHPENMLLLLEDGKLASMLALLPHGLTLPNGAEATAYYVYALATDAAVRSKGYGRQLLHYVDDHLRALGADCVTVVPAEPSLFKFFGTVGFAPGFSTRKVELLRDESKEPQPGDQIFPATPEEYNAIRNRLLTGTPAVTYDTELVRYQEGMCRLSGGGLYRILAGGVEGCAAVEYADEDSVLFKELLLPRQNIPQALAVFAQILPGRRCHVRTPAYWEGLPGSYLQPFGMLKWYNPDKAALWQEGTKGYMGLGFD